MIKDDSNSTFKQDMFDGVRYYRSKNTNISNRTFYFLTSKTKYKDGEKYDVSYDVEDTYRANNRIANGYLKTLIDQKVNYSLSKPIVVKGADNITNLIDINKIVRKMAKESSKKAAEWAHPYINAKGEFKVINISGPEIIPIYDTSFEQELKQVIRYYAITVQEGTEKKQRYKVELWDDRTVTYYMQDKSDKFYFDTEIDPNPAPHWQEVTIQLGTPIKIEGHGWGKVPFVPLWNNEEHTTDLEPVKAHIDVYDIIESDFANNIEDLQDAVLKLINYGGVTENLGEFINYLKKYKVLPLDENGDAEYMTTEIPIEARSKMLQILEDNIYKFGQGVNIDKVGDGNITNVVIKARYAGLDLKANDTEARITEFIEELFWFANEYLKIKGQQQDDLTKLEITFNRSMIINTNEIIDCVVKSKGIISDRTAISNHPFVTDIDEELALIATDKAANMAILDLDNPISEDGQTAQQEPVSGGTLNGAQVASLMQVVQQVATGIISKSAAIEIITSAFGLTVEKAEKILADAIK
jgi:SPP1 family phage portal protein